MASAMPGAGSTSEKLQDFRLSRWAFAGGLDKVRSRIWKVRPAGTGLVETWRDFYPRSTENAEAFLDGKPIRVLNAL